MQLNSENFCHFKLTAGFEKGLLFCSLCYLTQAWDPRITLLLIFFEKKICIKEKNGSYVTKKAAKDKPD